MGALFFYCRKLLRYGPIPAEMQGTHSIKEISTLPHGHEVQMEAHESTTQTQRHKGKDT